jgi:hypothetical protein
MITKGEFEKIGEEAVAAYFVIHSRRWSGGTEEIHKLSRQQSCLAMKASKAPNVKTKDVITCSLVAAYLRWQ